MEKIIIDYREKNSLVPSSLVRLGFEIEFKELKTGDYLVKETIIERKTVSDFISSMINKRLLNQIEKLKQYKNPLLIIEGIDSQDLYSDKAEGINANAIRGFLLSIILKHKIPIIMTKDEKDTAKFIYVLARKKETEISLKFNKKTQNKKEQLQFILEGFPGVGPKTAKKLLKEFKTLKEILNSPIENLTKTIGKKAEIFKLLDLTY